MPYVPASIDGELNQDIRLPEDMFRNHQLEDTWNKTTQLEQKPGSWKFATKYSREVSQSQIR